MADKEDTYVGAPYNFVPFDQKILLRYLDKEELPKLDCFVPGTHTGEITCTITAKTPVFISNGEKGEKTNFFQGANGKYMIPGSSVRGLVRTNMQILGYGAIRAQEDIADYKLMYRHLANGKEKAHYWTALGIKVKRSPKGKSYSVAEKAQAGYLSWENGAYIIRPTMENGCYYRVSRSDSKVPAEWKDRYCFAEEVWYQAADGKTAVSKTKQQGFRKGVILGSGEMKKQNHLYVFPAVDMSAEAILVSEEDLVSYRMDYDAKKNQLGKHKDFWKLPEPGQPAKPVFYVRYNGQLYWGVTQFLRIFYDHSIAEGLKESHRKRAGSVTLDYAHAVLGYTDQRDSYRSRVSFGDFEAQDNAKPGAPFEVILASPKPSSYQDYLKGGTYQNANFELRGFKQYWLKAAHVDGKTDTDTKERVISQMRPMPEGTCFTGKLRFQNLTEDELGLLLWCLRLEDGCFQSIGMGKPYGYGRVAVKINKLSVFDLEKRYTAEAFLQGDRAIMDKTAEVQTYIDAYRKYANRELKFDRGDKPSIEKQPRILDFLFMKRHIVEDPEQVRYMSIAQKEYQNRKKSLETVEDFRAREDKPKFEGDMRDALAAHWNVGLSNQKNTTKPPKGKKKK